MGMAAVEPQFHVLAVDDSIIDRKLIERLFRTSSCQVTTVDSGRKALQFLGLSEDNQNFPNQPSVFPNNHQEVQVNLVITDYCMPGMTGYDLLKKIKESSSLRNIPVVIMSSENVPSRISRCLEEGAEDFFLKPVRLSDVNKLRPHMVKNKKAEDQENQENQESLSSESSSAESGMTDVQSLPRQEQTEESQQSKAKDNSCNNKRKAMEESFVPKRTRPRCSSLTAFSDL